MLLFWLGGLCPCQLFDIYICILYNLLIVIHVYMYKTSKGRKGSGFHACVSGWEREWLKGSNGFNCHNRITQINWGQATHLDYMCTCAVSGGIVLAGVCAKSITQTDPWCWTSWKSWLVSGLHVPAQHSSCRMAAWWAGWGSVALSLLRACLQVSLTENTIQRTEERPLEQRALEINLLKAMKCYKLEHESLSSCTVRPGSNLAWSKSSRLIVLTSQWRHSKTCLVWGSWCVCMCA